jgi:hypothetical protein
MDFYTTSTESADNLAIKHVHCWHTDELFSKFRFGTGMYDDMDFTPQAAMSSIRDYVSVVAISSVRAGPKVLAKLATDDRYSSKADNWMRLKP